MRWLLKRHGLLSEKGRSRAVSIVGRRKSLRVDLLRWIILFRKHQGAARNQRIWLSAANLVTSGRAVTFPVKIRKAARRLCYSTLAKIHGTSILISTLEGSSCWVKRR